METLIASGKTKRVFRINDTDCGELEDQDVITWDDEFSAEVPDKGIWATETTCNIFELLARHGIPTAYLGRSENLRRLRVQLCEMIPLEVIVRLENAKNSSYGKRYPDVPIGPLPMPVVEFNLKTVKQVFNGDRKSVV